jgi:hypothetical protein
MPCSTGKKEHDIAKFFKKHCPPQYLRWRFAVAAASLDAAAADAADAAATAAETRRAPAVSAAF